MDKPLVSILVDNYNYGRFLREAVDSALDQTYPHTEVIVVDDGSTDNSREIIASYGDQIIPVLKENGGQASALNSGFAVTKGELICFLDSDDIFLPEKAAKIVSAFERYREIGCCFHPYRLVDNDAATLDKGTVIRANDEYTTCRWDVRREIQRGKLPSETGQRFIAPGLLGMCFKRSLLQQILPMPEATSVSISDNYIRFMAFALTSGVFLNEVLALQRIHGNNAYTFSNDRLLWARIRVLTAYWMRAKSPSTIRFTDKMLAAGIGTYWRIGGIESEYKALVRSYLSSATISEKLEIFLRILYHRFKPWRERF